MEDALAISSWNSPFGIVEYYAVFDGHGGSEVSSFLQNNFHIFLHQAMTQQSQPNNGSESSSTLQSDQINQESVSNREYNEIEDPNGLVKDMLLQTITEANSQTKKHLLKKNLQNKVIFFFPKRWLEKS